MRRLLYICILVLSAMSMMAENYASNARAEQVERTMVITYDLSKTTNVRLLVATNMSNDFKEVKKVTGAVGKNVQAGANRQITWNVLEEYDRFVADGVRFKVETYGAEGIGVFSVSSSKKVTFSPGNLQYHPANKLWRFAESQLDYIGDANSNCSSTYSGWLDLFGWSTSATYFGVSTSRNNYSGSFVDWGRNKIGNDTPNTWHTLSKDEWKYLLDVRPNAKYLKGIACVCGVNGLILLPDTWTCPLGVTFKSGYHSLKFSPNSYGKYQTFTADQWSKFEAAGAVFLPAAGYRDGSNVNYVQIYGVYWSATDGNSYYRGCLGFYSDEALMPSNYSNFGQSVRLVKDLQ